MKSCQPELVFAWESIGKFFRKLVIFDAKTFGKGYGEENDWCQRAIEKGYKNVHVENLFVFS